MDKRKCQGCHNDIYNHGAGGAKECFSLKTAKIIFRKEVHVDQIPPYKQAAKRFPSCYNKPRFCYLDSGSAQK